MRSVQIGIRPASPASTSSRLTGIAKTLASLAIATLPLAAESIAVPASCDALWPRIAPAASVYKFAVEASDRAGGFLRLKFIGGESTGKYAANDANRFTLQRSGFMKTVQRFRVVGASVTLAQDGDSCNMSMLIEMQGYINRLPAKQWYTMDSNGALEREILGRIVKQ